MAFPTATVTQGSGLTINTLPNAGQVTMANSLGVAIASDQSILPVTSFSSAAITNPTSVLTRPADVTAYAANDLIGTSTIAATASTGVPFFAIATSGGSAIISRLRLRTNITVGWDGINISVNLWTAHPTYTNGDNGAYVVSAGSTLWIGNFLIVLSQFGDGAVGASQPTGANEIALDLTAGTSVFWDMQVMAAATPISGQTFTLAAELLN
jgi:hypothetical protein